MQVQVKMKASGFKTIIPDKWSWAIWTLLFVASMVRNIVPFVDLFSGISGAVKITVAVLEGVLAYGLLPTVVCYVFSLILVTMTLRRRCMFCRRNDFVYICMLFTSAAYFVMGIIECFCFLDAAVYPYTSMLLNMTILTGAYCAMYFAVFNRMMNPRQRYVNFTAWSSLYLGLQGIVTLFSSVSYIILFTNSYVNEAVMEILQTYYGAPVQIDEGYATASIIAICLLAAWVIAAVVVAGVMKKKAKDYRPPEKDFNPFDNPGGGSPFEDYSDRQGGGQPKEEKVFEEFDL